MFNNLANQDFDRAVSRAFWRKVLSWLKGENNELLQYDQVRARINIRGHHYIGIEQVDINNIVGSMGRYNDFDRAFLPIQKRTKDRWVSIDKAHYEQIALPPVELYKIGEVYFVKDGNHRVSVARQRGQLFIDAYVIEIEIPFILTPDMKVDDLELKQEQAEFYLHTQLQQIRPGVEILAAVPDTYKHLLDHISVHRWYLGLERGAEVPYQDAVISWYDHVYIPVIELIHEHDLLKIFKAYAEADLYLWIMEFQGFLRQAYQTDDLSDVEPEEKAAQQLVNNYPMPAVKTLVKVVKQTGWVEDLALSLERATFLEQTQIHKIRPAAQIIATLLGGYDQLREHIAVHRWYLGEQRHAEVPVADAVASWYDRVYLPVVEIIREQDILKDFPGRTETDLYLWIVKHRWSLREAYGSEVPIEQAVENFTEEKPIKSEDR